jgi:hypothetical protein
MLRQLLKIRREGLAVIKPDSANLFVNQLAKALGGKIIILDRKQKFWRGAKYSVEYKGFQKGDEVVDIFSSVVIDEMCLPYYPGNIEISNLVPKLFEKMVHDKDPHFLLRPEHGGIFYQSKKFRQTPCITRVGDENLDDLIIRTRGVIDIYLEHENEFQELMKKLKKDYPVTDEEVETWIVTNHIPLSIFREGAYKTVIQENVISDSTGLFVPNEQKLDWFFEKAMVALQRPDAVKREIKTRPSHEFTNCEEYRILVVESLRKIDDSIYGNVDWERVYNAFPGARDIGLNLERKRLFIPYAHRYQINENHE